jgi:hypothetical protein
MPTERRPPVEVTDTTPIIHRVLVPPNEVIFVYGFVAQSVALPDVPMMWLGRELIAILPMRCLIERWTRGEPFHRDWSIVWSPPPGIDTTWLAEHPDWVAA